MRPLSLKQVIIASTGLALALNVGQLAHSALAARQQTLAPKPGVVLAAKTIVAKAVPAATPQPTPDPVAAATARLRAAGLRADYAALYLAVQARTGTPWQLLAAVHKVETGQSGSTARHSYAGAIGPMQFMPATFRAYALDGDGNGTRDITNLNDAMFTAGRYLAAGGADKGHYSNALYHYNHSWNYVYQVEGIARSLGL